MSRILRISLVVAAALAAVLAFVVLRPDDEANTAAESPPEATVTRDPASDAEAEPTPTPTPTPRPQPPLPLLTADATRTLTFERGDAIAFRVRHSSPDEIHVHGYDVSRQLPAGRTVTVRFPADIEGIFELELELEHSATPLGRLRVQP